MELDKNPYHTTSCLIIILLFSFQIYGFKLLALSITSFSVYQDSKLNLISNSLKYVQIGVRNNYKNDYDLTDESKYLRQNNSASFSH